jgi:hypothetical protein
MPAQAVRTRPSLAAVTADTPSTRNRAIDAYRAFAMCAVALGHWLAADVRNGTSGLTGGNGLAQLRSLHLLTWVFQVMPVFFCIGGFSNAASLDAHWRAGRPTATWVRARLSRLTAPSAWLAGTWIVVVIGGHLLGHAKLAEMAMAIAAIPLWFLGNYVIDTACAPFIIRTFRNHRTALIAGLATLFVTGESARLLGIGIIPQMNIVVGWMIFQVLGVAWREEQLPSGRRLLKISAAFYGLAATLVALGPWPLALVSVPGSRFANTWPPSAVLLAFGFGYCLLAIAVAPAISRYLSRHNTAWTIVVGANTITMTSYLWHFTALSIAAVLLAPTGLLPSTAVGTSSWWLHKMVLIGVAIVVLAVIVRLVGSKERAGLVGGSPSPLAIDHVRTGTALSVGLGLVLAAAFEVWTTDGGGSGRAVPAMATVVAVHLTLRRLASR